MKLFVVNITENGSKCNDQTTIAQLHKFNTFGWNYNRILRGKKKIRQPHESQKKKKQKHHVYVHVYIPSCNM